ncbi:MAG TPA: acetyl-CoA carboxylase carboxyltransferase subunit alpha [Bdellovibrionota bacterium]|jgi:acetyl-CoA carboxylase carboxyl transferase subunit alpha|nr:acetyl-CoA carboxylase carboxyltransferase subunit alpha [Bdellovibrionota bacterium]
MENNEGVNGKADSANEQNKLDEELAKAWSVVERSRHPLRPYTADYIESLFSEFEELKGDRCYGDDPAIIAGIGTLKPTSKYKEPMSVFVLGHQKGRKTKDKVYRNFAMAKPEGYRKAMRIMDLAERFQKPLVTFIDTPGAFPGVEAEERGQSEAIASSIMRMLKMNSPSVGIVIGEGGSGGALAIGCSDRLLMLENSTYSVISPESCAAILWGKATESKRAAKALKLTAKDVLKLGVCDDVIKEGKEGAHANFASVSESILNDLHESLRSLGKKNGDALLKNRYKRFRNIDAVAFE